VLRIALAFLLAAAPAPAATSAPAHASTTSPAHASTTSPAFVCGTPAPAHGKPARSLAVTVGLGTFSATFTASSAAGEPGAGFGSVRHPGLVVSAAGRPLAKLGISPPFSFSTLPGATDLMSLGKGPVCVVRFTRGTAVLVGTYSGGAHCCTWVFAYALGYRPVWQEIGDPGVTLRDYGGSAVLVTADDSFAYTFDSYAGSGMPVRTLQLQGGRFIDTTRQHLALVAADARFWWAQYKEVSGPKGEEPAGGLGVLAPWVADECLLGRSSSAWARVDSLQQRGAFDGGTSGWPKGAAYVRDLRAFLVKEGYCPAQFGTLSVPWRVAKLTGAWKAS
jgi:hypothetical protein